MVIPSLRTAIYFQDIEQPLCLVKIKEREVGHGEFKLSSIVLHRHCRAVSN